MPGFMPLSDVIWGREHDRMHRIRGTSIVHTMHVVCKPTSISSRLTYPFGMSLFPVDCTIVVPTEISILIWIQWAIRLIAFARFRQVLLPHLSQTRCSGNLLDISRSSVTNVENSLQRSGHLIAGRGAYNCANRLGVFDRL